MQPLTWGYCRERWRAGGTSHHRDKQPERRGRSPREDSESARHLRRRSKCTISWLQYSQQRWTQRRGSWHVRTNFPCPDNVSLFLDPHEDDADIHVPTFDGAGNARVHLVMSPDHPSQCVSSQSCLANGRSTPAFSSSSRGCLHSKDVFWWYVRLFCLLSDAFGKTSVVTKCLPVM